MSEESEKSDPGEAAVEVAEHVLHRRLTSVERLALGGVVAFLFSGGLQVVVHLLHSTSLKRLDANVQVLCLVAELDHPGTQHLCAPPTEEEAALLLELRTRMAAAPASVRPTTTVATGSAH